MDRMVDEEPDHKTEPERSREPEPEPEERDPRVTLPAAIGNAAMSRMVARAQTKRRGRGKPLEGDKRKRFLWTNILERRLGPGPFIATLVGARDCGRSIDEIQTLYEGTHDAKLAVDLANIEGATAERLVALANHPLRPSLGHIRNLVKAGRTASELSEIRAKGNRELTRFGLLSIAMTPGRSLQDVIDLAKAARADVTGERLAKLSGLGAPDEHRLTPYQAVDLARTPVSLQVLEGLLGHELELTPRQVEGLARAGRTVQDVTFWVDMQRRLSQRAVAALGVVAQLTRFDVARLANGVPGHRSVEDVATLAALQDGGPRFSAVDVLKVASAPAERSVDALSALATHPEKLTADEVLSLARAGRTAKDLTDLMQGPPVVARGDAITLASVKGRSLTDLGELATGVPSARPMTELAELASHGGDAPRLGTVDDIKTVGDTPARTVGELKDLLDHPLALTSAEVAAIGTAKRTGVELTTLSDDKHLPRADVIALASLRKRTMVDVLKLVDGKPEHRTIDDLVKLAELGDADPALTAQQVLTIAAIETLTQAQLITLGKGVKTLHGGRKTADLVAVASVGAPNFELTPEAAVRILDNKGLPPTLTKDHVVAFAPAVKGLTGDQIVALLGWLHPKETAPNTVSVLKRLKDSDVTAADIHAVVKAFKDAGRDGSQIYNRLDRYMTRFNTEDDVDITQPKTDVVAAGTRVLTGTELVASLKAQLVSGAPALATLDQTVRHYPTGENPATILEADLWKHCKLDPVVPIPNETAPQKPVRQRLALDELMTSTRFNFNAGVVQQLFAHDEGQSLRAIKLPGSEDALDPTATAHTLDRHVLNGAGTIKNLQDLALRSLTLGGTLHGHSPAGAFTTAAGAQAGIQAALDAYIDASPANLGALRHQIALGAGKRWTEAGINAAGARMDGAQTPYPQLPPYTTPGGYGTRPLYLGENFHQAAQADGKWRQRNNGAWCLVGVNNVVRHPLFFWDDAAGAPLAAYNAAPSGVTLRINSANVEGGFYIHSAWPE